MAESDTPIANIQSKDTNHSGKIGAGGCESDPITLLRDALTSRAEVCEYRGHPYPRVVKPEQEVHEGGLPASRSPYQSARGPRGNVKVDTLENLGDGGWSGTYGD